MTSDEIKQSINARGRAVVVDPDGARHFLTRTVTFISHHVKIDCVELIALSNVKCTVVPIDELSEYSI